jgi:uncharacterized SAM-binding protein YcdF (DUF218 family)
MIFLRTFSAALLIAVFGWGLALLSIFLFGRVDEAREVDAIVVLGAAQYDGRPSPVLKARLDHALELYERGLSSRLIMTGGVGVGDTVSEAEVGRRYAVRSGVDGENILVEGSGMSSEESMVAVARLMERHELNSALLVSDPFHMLRLRLLGAVLGIRAYSSPTFSSPIEPGSPDEWRHVARESLIIPGLAVGRLIRGVRSVGLGADSSVQAPGR